MKYEEVLPVNLTEEELRYKGDALAKKMLERDKLEYEKKVKAAEYKERIDEINVEASALAGNIRTRSEMRPVACLDEKDYDARRINRIRCDTGEIISSRPMDIDDLQENAFDDGGDAGGRITLLGGD